MKFRMNVLDRMRLWQKFLLLGGFALIAAAYPFYQVIVAAERDIAVALDEQAGLPPVIALLKTVQYAQQHRGLSFNLLAGNEALAASRAAAEAEADKAIAEADALMAAKLEARPKLADDWSRIKQGWKATAAAVSQRSHDPQTSFEAHTALIAQMLTMLEATSDAYSLSLDPTAHSYFLIQAVTVHFPRLTELLGQARALGTGRLAEAARLRNAGEDPAQAVGGAERARLRALVDAIRESSGQVYRFADKAFALVPELKTTLGGDADLAREASTRLEQLALKEIVEAPLPGFDAGTYFQSYTAGIDTQFEFLFEVAGQLQTELERIAADKRRSEIVTTAQILGALLLAVLVGTLTVFNVRRTVASLQAAVEQVRGGAEAALQNIEAQDEVGDLGRTVNLLLSERIAAQRKAEDENERLNDSVISLLQAVNQLSQRDLTARAPVTQDIIGTVSDSINALTDETARVLNGVTRIAGQVAAASGKVQTQAALVSKTAEDEHSSVDQLIESLADATQTMNQVSALVEQSNSAAGQATQATDIALDTVTSTVRDMESIRETIAETEKRIKRLGERSQEISGIVNLINTISERTHVLALNASMQAAVAGEAGRGFAVVAEEVQRLAESSRNATQQIATLVGNIQLETNETINTVNRTIGKVVQGSEQARRAGEQMRHTQDITSQLVAQVRRIGDASDQQKSMSANLLAAIQRIGASTDRTAEQIELQNAETESLLQSARQLVESVNVFKLPQ